MSEPKWTPGPWNQIRHEDTCSRVGAKTLIAVVYSEAFRDTDNQIANAQIIAAAPDLYEALAAIMSDNLHSFPARAPEMALAALAEARGGK